MTFTQTNELYKKLLDIIPAGISDIVVVPLSLTMNRFHTFWCFCCWLWWTYCQLGFNLLKLKVKIDKLKQYEYHWLEVTYFFTSLINQQIMQISVKIRQCSENSLKSHYCFCFQMQLAFFEIFPVILFFRPSGWKHFRYKICLIHNRLLKKVSSWLCMRTAMKNGKLHDISGF